MNAEVRHIDPHGTILSLQLRSGLLFALSDGAESLGSRFGLASRHTGSDVAVQEDATTPIVHVISGYI